MARGPCGQRILRLPSVAGTDAAELDAFIPPLPSRQRINQLVAEALNEIETSNDPVLVMLIAEWGEGKTSVYNSKMKPWITSKGWVSLETRAATAVAYLREVPRAERSPAYRILASILAAALESEGILHKFGTPSSSDSLKRYVVDVISELSDRGKRKVVVFVDEFEDLVASASEEELSEIVAGLVGLVNGEIREVSASCTGSSCMPGAVNLVISLTPPAYSQLTSSRNMATVAARLKRRVRVVWITPLSRREAFAFLESLARYSMGSGLRGLLQDYSLAHAVVSSSLGNMGALVSAFRYLANWARGRGGCGDAVKLLGAGDILSALSGLVLSVGGAELPAINQDIYSRLRESWEARSKLAGLNPSSSLKVVDELVVRGVASEEDLAAWAGISENMVRAVVEEFNIFSERSWVSQELGVRRAIYKVHLADAVEDAFKALALVEAEVAKVLPQLTPSGRMRPLEVLLDSLVYMDKNGRTVLALPASLEDAADLVADAAPVELSRSEAARLAEMLWDSVISKLAAFQYAEAYLLSPRLQRALFVSPELHYLDFITDRTERLKVVRKVYSEGSRAHLVAGIVSLLSHEELLSPEGYVAPQGEAAARAVLQTPSGGTVRAIIYATLGGISEEEARQAESQVTAAILSGWRPHIVIVAYQGTIEPRAESMLESLEAKLFIKVVKVPIPSLTMRVRLQALGAKLYESFGSAEAALQAAAAAPRSREVCERAGLDHPRLSSMLRETADELQLGSRIVGGLEEGVEGTPLVVRDPVLGYDVEKPTELSGALRYFLVVPSTRATSHEALRAAHEYVMKYHIYRGAGESRGIMSPDIDRSDRTALEKYMTLLTLNKMLAKQNGSVRIDVLSPQEKAVLRALEQLGARSNEVPASAVWDVLVVEARNPGTQRMLLQSLLYRGVISAGEARRIDPEKSRLRVTLSTEYARQLIEKTKSMLRSIEDDADVIRWGYIVSAKAKDFRAGRLADFVKKARYLVSTAEEAMKAGDLLLALRLARTAYDVTSYVADEVVRSHVMPAVEKARTIRSKLLETIKTAKELLESAERVIRNLAPGSSLRLKYSKLSLLENALKLFEEIENLELTEDELEDIVKGMWNEARRQSPRDPGRRLPFYIGGLGPRVHFNYKLWLLIDGLSKLGLAKLSESEMDYESALASVLEGVEGLLEKLRQAAERVAELRRLAEDVSAKLSSLGVGGVRVKFVKPSLAGIAESGELELEEVSNIVSRVLADIETQRRPLLELSYVIEGVEEALSRLEEAEKGARSWKEIAASYAEKASRVSPQAEKVLRQIEADLGLALDQAAATRAKALQLVKSTGGNVEGLLQAVQQAEKLLESSLVILRDSTERAKREIARIRQEAEERVRLLQAEAEALRALLAKHGADVKAPEKPEEPFEAIKSARKAIEDMKRLALKMSILSTLEVEAYSTVTVERSRRGGLLFTEAVRLVAEKLHIDEVKARKILLGLIERGVLEPRL
ncbi:MAG: hypothetical protein ABWW70_04365 [Thermoproteota archaeon]